MSHEYDEIKTHIGRRQSGLTALAQLVAIYANAGITSTAELAVETGYSERAIRKAKAELGCRNQDADGGTRVPKRHRSAGTGVPEAAPECRGTDLATRALMESSSKILSNEDSKSKNPPYPPKPDFPPPETKSLDLYVEGADRVRFAQGRLELCSDLRKFWLDQFEGDDKRLDLALIEVAGRVQRHGHRPLEAQVSSQLARIVADKRDRDRRYEQARASNGSKPNPFAKPAIDWKKFDMLVSKGSA